MSPSFGGSYWIWLLRILSKSLMFSTRQDKTRKADAPSQLVQFLSLAGPMIKPAGEKGNLQIGTQLLLHVSSHAVSSLHAMAVLS
jgi:hypothetical protein